ncbi:disease resistance TIR-NBS-LRR class family protein [Tanacetum coccineum]|uniref:Disease resistance TIR-NBS-LRR class family protein n=1 Tax=Tanacetum coccineum TaxID=301880 RepID=A0ABQ5C2J7_9ASTR
MASTSSSPIQKSFKYDVFLSFRGVDTRNNFVGHLYQALKQKGIETYKDDEKIEKGKMINEQLIKSIEDSRFYIIVFSKKYASSSWCLDELVKIMECQKTIDHIAYPVFHNVEPAEVRKQSGPVRKAFAKNTKKEAARKWRDAMKEASNLAGWELKATANGDESKLIEIIVDNIFKKLHFISSSIDGKLVGMEMRINEVLTSLKICTEDVRVIGIKGMGGGGKTTLARAVYVHISSEFEDVLNDQGITVSSVADGKDMMGKSSSLSLYVELIEFDIPDGCPKLQSLNLNNSKLQSLNLGPSPNLETLSLCMTRSSTKELLSPFENPEQKFHSRRRLFDTPSLIESNLPEFDHIFDIEEQSKEEVKETMTETMEQYMSKTRGDYGSGVTRPTINQDTHFELKGQFLKELRDNTFSRSEHEDANEHIEKILEIADLFHIPKITQDQNSCIEALALVSSPEPQADF